MTGDVPHDKRSVPIGGKCMNAWLDGVMGVVVGDALGSPAQFRDRTYLKRNPITKMEYCECFDMEHGLSGRDSF